MEREAFIKAMEEAPDNLDTNWATGVIIENIIASAKHDDTVPLKRQLVIAIEELAELAKELTKALRGNVDRTAILEEYADVWIVLATLQGIFNFKNDELMRAEHVKLKRIEDKLRSDGVYQ